MFHILSINIITGTGQEQQSGIPASTLQPQRGGSGSQGGGESSGQNGSGKSGRGPSGSGERGHYNGNGRFCFRLFSIHFKQDNQMEGTVGEEVDKTRVIKETGTMREMAIRTEIETVTGTVTRTETETAIGMDAEEDMDEGMERNNPFD